jgi:hypothetical protein
MKILGGLVDSKEEEKKEEQIEQNDSIRIAQNARQLEKEQIAINKQQLDDLREMEKEVRDYKKSGGNLKAKSQYIGFFPRAEAKSPQQDWERTFVDLHQYQKVKKTLIDEMKYVAQQADLNLIGDNATITTNELNRVFDGYLQQHFNACQRVTVGGHTRKELDPLFSQGTMMPRQLIQLAESLVPSQFGEIRRSVYPGIRQLSWMKCNQAGQPAIYAGTHRKPALLPTPRMPPDFNESDFAFNPTHYQEIIVTEFTRKQQGAMFGLDKSDLNKRYKQVVSEIERYTKMFSPIPAKTSKTIYTSEPSWYCVVSNKRKIRLKPIKLNTREPYWVLSQTRVADAEYALQALFILMTVNSAIYNTLRKFLCENEQADAIRSIGNAWPIILRSRHPIRLCQIYTFLGGEYTRPRLILKKYLNEDRVDNMLL